jgi:hypothetical protein
MSGDLYIEHPMSIRSAFFILTIADLRHLLNFSGTLQALRILAFGTGIAYGSVKLGYLKVGIQSELSKENFILRLFTWLF